MIKWSGKFVLNYHVFNQDTFPNYLKIKMLSFPKRAPIINRSKINTEINAFEQQNGLFKCIDKHCKFCSLYIVEGHSFNM